MVLLVEEFVLLGQVADVGLRRLTVEVDLHGVEVLPTLVEEGKSLNLLVSG